MILSPGERRALCSVEIRNSIFQCQTQAPARGLRHGPINTVEHLRHARQHSPHLISEASPETHTEKDIILYSGLITINLEILSKMQGVRHVVLCLYKALYLSLFSNGSRHKSVKTMSHVSKRLHVYWLSLESSSHTREEGGGISPSKHVTLLYAQLLNN